ncbi:MAG: MerR family transcriptional regulator [Pseudomonadota bacterium]
MSKGADAFRTISEVADWLGVQTHVLRFWESKFTQIKPVKRAGGRRYYRPADMLLLGGVRKLLHDDGMTIKGVQKILREQGIAAVSDLSPPLQDGPIDGVPAPEAPMVEAAAPAATVTPLRTKPPAPDAATDLEEADAAPDAGATDSQTPREDEPPAAAPDDAGDAPTPLPSFLARPAEAPETPQVPDPEPNTPEGEDLLSPPLPGFLTRAEPPRPAARRAPDPTPPATKAPAQPPVEETPRLPAFLQSPAPQATHQPATPAPAAPEPVAPKPRIVDAPDPPLDAAHPAGPLSHLAALRRLPAHQRAALRPMAVQLAQWQRNATGPR